MRRVPRSVVPAVAAVLILLVPTGFVLAQAAPDSATLADPNYTPRWIFAVEDTLDLPAFFRMSPQEVRADRVRIGDILKQCIEREKQMREAIETYEATMQTKLQITIGDVAAPERQYIEERVEKVIYRKPNRSRSVLLLHERYKIEDGEREEWDDDAAVEIGFEDFNDLPFYLEETNDYDFDIRSREIVGDRVIYEVALEPKSDFDIAPQGVIWIDASNYQILREEFDFGDRAPMPLFVKSVGPFVRERVQVGDIWVWKRMRIRLDLRLGFFRFMEESIPDTVQLLVDFQDHRVNEGLSTGRNRDESPTLDEATEGTDATDG